jgi:putative ABC transport system permease protein
MAGVRDGVRRLFHLALHRPDLAQEDMDEELRFYLDARVAQLVAQGMTREQARIEALRRLGGTYTETRRRLQHSAQRRERRMRAYEVWDDLIQDLRYAVRGLGRRPGFTAVAILTLAIGIGANTAVFSAVYALLLRPLPFPDPSRLMDIVLVAPSDHAPMETDYAPWSFPKFVVFRDAQRSFQELALYSDDRFSIMEGEPERVEGATVSAKFLATLGVAPAVGHDFAPDLDAHPGAPRQVIVSDALWKRRYNADPHVVGRAMRIDGEPYEIIGVAPPEFKGLSGRAEIFVPLTTRGAEDLAQAWSLEFDLIGRLRPGVTPAQARSEAVLLGTRVYDAYPMRNAIGSAARGGWGASARPLDATRTAPLLRRSLLVLFGAVGFVLLIACVNLANLLLGRAATRQREIAIRLAIGAGRSRLVRQLLTESLLLGLAGGAAGVLLAAWGVRLLRAVNPAGTLQVQGLAGLGAAGFATIRLDAVALGFALVAALLTGLLFGLLPALEATRPSLVGALKAGGGAGRRHGPFGRLTSRRLLIVTEVALALVLLAGSGLMVRSLGRLLAVDPGFDAQGLLTLRLNVPHVDVPRDSMPGFYTALLDRLAVLPGVTTAALGDCPPLNGGCNGTIITFPDGPPIPPEAAPAIGVHTVTPGWFATLRVPLKRGRLFTAADRLGAPKVILVSESAARRYWPNRDPIGTRAAIWQGGFHTGATVIGVVGDVRYNTIDSLPQPDAYLSYFQAPQPRMMIFLRTPGQPAALGAAARNAIHELAPAYPVYDLQPMTTRVAAASAQARFSALLLAVFAAVALALAALGIYWVIAFTVAQRTREIGVRMALGADRREVVRMILGEGFVLAGAGAVIGLAAALALTRVLRSLLYDVAPSDPLTYGIIVAVLGAAAVVAAWIPARRAARVDPVVALKGE